MYSDLEREYQKKQREKMLSELSVKKHLIEEMNYRCDSSIVRTTSDSTSLYTVFKAIKNLNKRLAPYNKLFFKEANKIKNIMNLHMALRKKMYNGLICSNIVFSINSDCNLLSCEITFNNGVVVARYVGKNRLDTPTIITNNIYGSYMDPEELEKYENSIRYAIKCIKPFFEGLNAASNEFNFDYEWDLSNRKQIVKAGDKFITASFDLSSDANPSVVFTNSEYNLIGGYHNIIDQDKDHYAKRTKINFYGLDPLVRNCVISYIASALMAPPQYSMKSKNNE